MAGAVPRPAAVGGDTGRDDVGRRAVAGARRRCQRRGRGYAPGTGWAPEFLYNGAGVVQTPTLHGVAWPEPGRAYAVGDNGAMWLWRSETDLWEPDPAKPLNFHANLNAVAFAPGNSALGYAVGKQGVLLAYSKTWEQQTVPASVAQAHFTSVAFAGNQAIVSYRMINPAKSNQEEGGLLIDNGSGWQVDQSAQALLSTLPAGQTVISKVAGLPDGGAVAAGPGVVIERDSATSPWRFSSSPIADSETGNIAALAAFRDGSSVRALVSVDDDPESDPSGIENTLWQNVDNPPASAAGQPPLLIGPDPLPSHGFLVRETANGWADQELNDHPNLFTGGASNFDLPGWPDAVLALATDTAGDQGWAVGGQTGGDALQLGGQTGAAKVVQTAGVTRFGGGASPPISTSSPIDAPAGQPTLAFGGGSGCAQPCSANASQQLGPDAWLRGAISRAGTIGGLRAFVYLGQRIESGATTLDGDTYARELADYSDVLFSSSLPVYTEATQQDIATGQGGAPTFAQGLGAHDPAGATPAGGRAPPAGTAAYAFDSPGNGGTVRVIVLDYSSRSLSGNGQLTWLAGELDSARAARIPAIVVGSGDITDAGVPNAALDASAVAQVLETHGASAYVFYDASQQNVAQSIGSGAQQLPVFGTGTLGYVRPPTNAAAAQAFLGASGFLVMSVNAAQRSVVTNRAPVTAKLIPDAGELALDATDGTLLRRSQVALFQGLARRPLGGSEWVGGAPGSEGQAPDPYTALPETCLGSACGHFIQPVYSFTSSNPKIGDFVERDPNSTNPRQILQNAKGNPIPDPTSGVFCAYNPGTTTVAIASGGLSYSEDVTVQRGASRSPAEPCPPRTSSRTRVLPAGGPAPTTEWRAAHELVSATGSGAGPAAAFARGPDRDDATAAPSSSGAPASSGGHRAPDPRRARVPVCGDRGDAAEAPAARGEPHRSPDPTERVRRHDCGGADRRPRRRGKTRGGGGRRECPQRVRDLPSGRPELDDAGRGSAVGRVGCRDRWRRDPPAQAPGRGGLRADRGAAGAVALRRCGTVALRHCGGPLRGAFRGVMCGDEHGRGPENDDRAGRVRGVGLGFPGIRGCRVNLGAGLAVISIDNVALHPIHGGRSDSGGSTAYMEEDPPRPPGGAVDPATPVATTRLNVGSGHEMAARGYHFLTRRKVYATTSVPGKARPSPPRPG